MSTGRDLAAPRVCWALSGAWALPLQLRRHLRSVGFAAHVCDCGHGGVLPDVAQALRAHFRSHAHLSEFPEEAPAGTVLHEQYRAGELRGGGRRAQADEARARIVALAGARGGVALADLQAEFGWSTATLVRTLLRERRIARAHPPNDRRRVIFVLPRAAAAATRPIPSGGGAAGGGDDDHS